MAKAKVKSSPRKSFKEGGTVLGPLSSPQERCSRPRKPKSPKAAARSCQETAQNPIRQLSALHATPPTRRVILKEDATGSCRRSRGRSADNATASAKTRSRSASLNGNDCSDEIKKMDKPPKPLSSTGKRMGVNERAEATRARIEKARQIGGINSADSKIQREDSAGTALGGFSRSVLRAKSGLRREVETTKPDGSTTSSSESSSNPEAKVRRAAAAKQGGAIEALPHPVRSVKRSVQTGKMTTVRDNFPPRPKSSVSVNWRSTKSHTETHQLKEQRAFQQRPATTTRGVGRGKKAVSVEDDLSTSLCIVGKKIHPLEIEKDEIDTKDDETGIASVAALASGHENPEPDVTACQEEAQGETEKTKPPLSSETSSLLPRYNPPEFSNSAESLEREAAVVEERQSGLHGGKCTDGDAEVEERNCAKRVDVVADDDDKNASENALEAWRKPLPSQRQRKMRSCRNNNSDTRVVSDAPAENGDPLMVTNSEETVAATTNYTETNDENEKPRIMTRSRARQKASEKASNDEKTGNTTQEPPPPPAPRKTRKKGAPRKAKRKNRRRSVSESEIPAEPKQSALCRSNSADGRQPLSEVELESPQPPRADVMTVPVSPSSSQHGVEVDEHVLGTNETPAPEKCTSAPLPHSENSAKSIMSKLCGFFTSRDVFDEKVETQGTTAESEHAQAEYDDSEHQFQASPPAVAVSKVSRSTRSSKDPLTSISIRTPSADADDTEECGGGEQNSDSSNIFVTPEAGQPVHSRDSIGSSVSSCAEPKLNSLGLLNNSYFTFNHGVFEDTTLWSDINLSHLCQKLKLDHVADDRNGMCEALTIWNRDHRIGENVANGEAPSLSPRGPNDVLPRAGICNFQELPIHRNMIQKELIKPMCLLPRCRRAVPILSSRSGDANTSDRMESTQYTPVPRKASSRTPDGRRATSILFSPYNQVVTFDLEGYERQDKRKHIHEIAQRVDVSTNPVAELDGDKRWQLARRNLFENVYRVQQDPTRSPRFFFSEYWDEEESATNDRLSIETPPGLSTSNMNTPFPYSCNLLSGRQAFVRDLVSPPRLRGLRDDFVDDVREECFMSREDEASFAGADDNNWINRFRNGVPPPTPPRHLRQRPEQEQVFDSSANGDF